MSKPAEISGAKKQLREKIATIVTGLYVLSKPTFRKSVEIDDATYRKILAQLTSNKAAAHHVMTAGARLPSMQTTLLTKLGKLDKLPQGEQKALVAQLKSIHDSLR